MHSKPYNQERLPATFDMGILSMSYISGKKKVNHAVGTESLGISWAALGHRFAWGWRQ